MNNSKKNKVGNDKIISAFTASPRQREINKHIGALSKALKLVFLTDQHYYPEIKYKVWYAYQKARKMLVYLSLGKKADYRGKKQVLIGLEEMFAIVQIEKKYKGKALSSLLRATEFVKQEYERVALK